MSETAKPVLCETCGKPSTHPVHRPIARPAAFDSPPVFDLRIEHYCGDHGPQFSEIASVSPNTKP